MNISIPTNSEMYDRIFLKNCQHDGDRKAVIFWNELYDFSKNNGLLESNFDNRCKQNFHGCFWELYLPKVFEAENMMLSRKGKGKPDFCFEKDGKEFYLEAVVCGEPSSEKNRVPVPSGSFESGKVPEAQIMQRMASSISDKIKKFKEKYTSKIDKTAACYVIAINGYRAINAHIDDVFYMPYVVKTLFGIGDLRLFYSSNGERLGSDFEYIEETKNGAPVGHFSRPENKDIAGILYSNAYAWQSNLSLGHDFVFVQNPFAEDISHVFNFCKKGIWVRESLGYGKFRAKKVNAMLE